MAVDSQPPDDQRKRDGMLGGCRVAAGELEVSLEVGVTGGVDPSAHRFQKRDFGGGGGVPSELDGIAIFKELAEGP